jgi:flavin reductase (DIM6/NTAB) family NADH-FMN oxidoreductase RutF
MAYLGSVSGRDEDKIDKAGLTPVYADNTVYFQEAKLVFICKKVYASEILKNRIVYQDTIEQCYPQDDYHTMYVGKIEKVMVRDGEYLG